MIFRDIYNPPEGDLEKHIDKRGLIADIFYNANINHVAVVQTDLPCVRGNHYHKETTQHILMIEGWMTYFWRSVDDDEWESVVVGEGALITTPPNVVHTLVYESPAKFIVFSEGKRGGKDYESDTFRVEPLNV